MKKRIKVFEQGKPSKINSKNISKTEKNCIGFSFL